MKITATIENTKTDSPKIDSAGVDTGAKMLVGLIRLFPLRVSRFSLATFCWSRGQRGAKYGASFFLALNTRHCTVPIGSCRAVAIS